MEKEAIFHPVIEQKFEIEFHCVILILITSLPWNCSTQPPDKGDRTSSLPEIVPVHIYCLGININKTLL